jgi:hypothetical protein
MRWIPLLVLAACTAGDLGHEGNGLLEAGLMCMDQMGDGEQCMLDGLEEGEGEELLEGGCWITGGGHIGDENSHGGAGQNDQDSFGFNAMGMKAGYVRGEIENVDHLGNVFHGHATWIRCWKDAGDGPEVPRAIPNNAEWGGHGSWNHVDGHTWKAHLADRAEGGSHRDEYEIWVWDSGGALVYSQTAADDLVITGGNFQIHPPNGGHPYLAGECAEAPGCPRDL